MPRASAFDIGVVVWVFSERLVTHIGSIVHELEHFWRFFEVDIDHLLGHILTKQGVHEVLLGILMVIFSTRLLGVVIIRNPDTATGSRTRPTDLVGFFDDQDVFGAQFPVTDCSRQSAVACADYQNINFTIPC